MNLKAKGQRCCYCLLHLSEPVQRHNLDTLLNIDGFLFFFFNSSFGSNVLLCFLAAKAAPAGKRIALALMQRGSAEKTTSSLM